MEDNTEMAMQALRSSSLVNRLTHKFTPQKKKKKHVKITQTKAEIDANNVHVKWLKFAFRVSSTEEFAISSFLPYTAC